MTDARAFPNPYQRQTRGLAAATVASVVLAVVGGLYGAGPGPWLALMIAGVLLASFVGIFWLAWFIVGRGVEAELVRFRRGEALAQWEVDAAQWAPFAAQMRKKGALGALLTGAGTAVVLGITGLIIVFSEDDPNGWWIGAGGVVFGTLLWAVVRHTMTSAYDPTRGAGEFVIGERVCLVNRAKILPWSTCGYTFREASVDRERHVLVIGGQSSGGHADVPFTHEIPVPAARLDDAAVAAAALTELHR